jgi:hypothetical protein
MSLYAIADLLRAMDDIFGRVWLRCSQLAVILLSFQIGKTLKTESVRLIPFATPPLCI